LLANVSAALTQGAEETKGREGGAEGGSSDGVQRSQSEWNRVGEAMKEEIDEQGFKSVDDRLEYFLQKASVVRVKPGQTVVSPGAMWEWLDVREDTLHAAPKIDCSRKWDCSVCKHFARA
jgi:hypothetical protein